MRERGWGRVVAIGSMRGARADPGLQLSNAHRPGLIAAFKVLAKRVAADGVTLNTVLPGGSPPTGSSPPPARPRRPRRRRAARSRPGGSARVEELAAAAVFLCSAPASYITGTTLLVDGGVSASVSLDSAGVRAVSSIGRARDFWKER